jgi:hypothetical protein
MHQPAQVEQLGPVVDLRPEALLEPLLGLAQPFGVLEVVQVREDAHDLGEAVDLKQPGDMAFRTLLSSLCLSADFKGMGKLQNLQESGKLL